MSCIRPYTRRSATAAIAIAGALAVVALAVRSLPFMTDDAFISMRYSARLLAGRGLTWTDNLPPVEGYSNLSWVLLTAGLGALGVDLVTAVRALGLGFHLLTIPALLLAFGAQRCNGWSPAAVAVLAFALSLPVGIWTVGGLEQPLVVCGLAWALALALPLATRDESAPRAALAASLPLGVLAVTRPDGLLFSAAILLGLALARGARARSLAGLWPMLAFPCACAAAQLAFRLAYYGDWVPNTAHAKLSGSLKHLRDGLRYLGPGLLAAAPVSLVAIGFPLWAAARRAQLAPGAGRRLTLLSVVAAAWGAYVVFIGGDIFPGWRHILPLVVLGAFLVGEATLHLSEHWAQAADAVQTARRRRGVGVACAVMLTIYVGVQFVNGQNRRAFEETWEWDSRVAGLLLGDLFGEAAPVLAVDAAGSTVYWSGLPALDMLGLNDDWLPKHPPKTFGTGRIGHELGDGEYVLGKRPDLIAFGYQFSQWPYERGSVELVALPEFSALYTFVRMRGERPYRYDFGVWVLREGPRIGLRREADRVAVPAWLLNGNEATIVTRAATGDAVVAASRGAPVRLASLTLGAGTWRVEPAASGALDVTVAVGAGPSAALGPEARFALEVDGAVTLTLAPKGAEAVDLRGLVLRREP